MFAGFAVFPVTGTVTNEVPSRSCAVIAYPDDLPALIPDGTLTVHWKYPADAFQAQAAVTREMPGPVNATRTWPALASAAAQVADALDLDLRRRGVDHHLDDGSCGRALDVGTLATNSTGEGRQAGVLQIGLLEVGTAEAHAGQVRIRQVGTGEVSAGQVAPTPVDACGGRGRHRAGGGIHGRARRRGGGDGRERESSRHGDDHAGDGGKEDPIRTDKTAHNVHTVNRSSLGTRVRGDHRGRICHSALPTSQDCAGAAAWVPRLFDLS